MGIIAIKGLLIGCGIQKNQATPTIRRKNGILILKSVPTITSTCNFIPTADSAFSKNRTNNSCDTFLGTICPWGLNWLGTVCPEVPINWGPIVRDQMSGDHICLGPKVSQPK